MLNVVPLLDNINTKTFLEDYLHAYGIDDVNEYLSPNQNCFDNPKDYPNIDEAVALLKKHIDNKSKMGVLNDSDFDGQASASIAVNFLMSLGLKYDKDIRVFIHTAKQHGLRENPEEDIVQQVLDSKVNLLIVPDAGTNDKTECKKLKENGVDVLILDHHEVTTKNPYAIIVNHHLGKGLNTDLPGAGVTLKFVQHYCNTYNVAEPYYYDLVAASIVSDVCNLTSFENRAFLNIGLNAKTVQNPMLNLMFEKACKRGVNPEGLAWGANPLVNSLCRGKSFEDKVTFFKALATGENITEGLKVANRAHRVQTNETKKIMEEIEPDLDNSHKVIIGFLNPENKNYIGLVANKIMSNYNKPTILLREKNSTEWSGSLRSAIPLLTKINETKLATCIGHEYACGIVVKKSNLEKLIAWLDTLDLSATPDVPVTAILSTKQVSVELSQLVDKWKILWGAGLPKPNWSMDIIVDSKNVTIYKKKTTTIKTNYRGIDILLFFAKDKDVESFKHGGKCRIVFDINVNEWNGSVKPQCVVNKYEFLEETENSWEDDF